MSRSFGLSEKEMGRKTKIRKIRPQDLPEIVSIQESILQKKVSKKWIQIVNARLKKQEAVAFVASMEGRVVGFIIGEIKGESFGLEQSGWIEVVGVHPSYMGIGIGRILAEKLFEIFQKKGIRDIYTTVLWDAGDMLSFFKAIGFDRSPFINLRKQLD
ncbi:MAG TPA: GNAT family N-acetyltransferase [Thermodesulfobacteriota bacterium]|nr:GNAT family N-acetyltransferase [Thermodesulfobacteriota bacterium]